MSDLFYSESRHKPQTDNASTWRSGTVELIDGRKVASDSPEWLAECEAMTVLSWPIEKRPDFFDMVQRHRGEAGLSRLKAAMSQALPRYVLEMPSRDARRAYLEAYEKRVSRISRQRLEEAVKALWAKRQANTCKPDAA